MALWRIVVKTAATLLVKINVNALKRACSLKQVPYHPYLQ